MESDPFKGVVYFLNGNESLLRVWFRLVHCMVYLSPIILPVIHKLGS